MKINLSLLHSWFLWLREHHGDWELGRIKLEKIPGLFLFHPASWVLSHFGKINGGNTNERYSGWKIQNILQISQPKTPQQVRATTPVQHGTHLPQTQRGTTTNCRLATGLPTGFLYSCHTEMLNLSQGAVPKKPSVIIQILCLPSKPHRVNRGGGTWGRSQMVPSTCWPPQPGPMARETMLRHNLNPKASPQQSKIISSPSLSPSSTLSPCLYLISLEGRMLSTSLHCCAMLARAGTLTGNVQPSSPTRK